MVNDSNIITIDSIESKMKVNKFSGNHSQETREGYNLWDYLNVVKASAGGLTIEKDYENGYITVNGTPNENYVYISSSIFITDMLEDGQRYTLWQEIYGGEGTTDGIYLQVTRTADNETTVRYYSRNNSASFLVDKSNNASYSITLQTSSVDGTGTLTNYRNRYMLYKGTAEKSYELPGASPSLDYPSRVRAVGDNVNIFDGEIEEGSYSSSNGEKVTASNTIRNKNFIDVSNFETIIFSNDGIGLAVNIYEYDKDYTFIKSNIGYASNKPFNKSTETKYINFAKGNTNFDKIKIESGEIITSYSPYGQGSVEVKKINKNWVKIDTPRTVERGGLSITLDDEGVFTINGTSTANIYINLINIGEYQNTTLTNYKLPLKKYKAYFDLIQKNNSAVSESNGDASFNIRNFAASSTGEQATSYCVFGGLIKGNTGVQIKDCNITDGRVVAYLYVANGVKLDNFKFRFALYNENETDTTYEKHEEQSYILDIQKPMLNGDCFDFKNNKEVHIWKENTLNGTENWQQSSIYNDIYYLQDNNMSNDISKGNLICDQFFFGGIVTSTDDMENNKCYRYQTGTILSNNIYVKNSNFKSVTDFKAALAEKNMTLYYIAKYATQLDLIKQQKEVLNQLQNIILYDDTTNIVLPDVYPILDYDVSKIIDTTTTFEASLDSNGYFVVPDYDIKCLVSYSESDIPSMPEAVETAVSVPGRDGDIPLNTIYNPISFTIVCYTEDNLTPEEKYAEETKMNKFLNSIKNNTIKLKLESKGKYYNVKYNGQLTTTNYPKHLQFSIPLKSSSSYAKDIDESYILGNGEKESDTIKEVGAVFVIEGPAQTPKISLNDYEMFYDNVLLSNTKLVIDSNKSTVTMINREGTATNAMRYYNHEFPKIQNGNNVLKVLSGIDEDRQVNVRWFDLKL